ncbi:MAG: hypothetical protein Q8R32_01020 [bacterium]|nr:hypothetical protein [bacterium]
MEHQPQRPDKVSPDPEADEILGQIRERSQALAALYRKLAETEARAVPADVDDPVERERLHLQKTDLQSEAVRAEIRQLNAELMKLGERLEAHRHGGSRGPLTPQEEEEISLQRRLSKLADDQNEAVRRWNRDPSPERRPAFEEELWQLYREYGEVLARLKTLRAHPRLGG